MEQYPHLVEMILEGGHEIAAHGYLHENPNKLTPEEELYWFDRQVDVIKDDGKKSERLASAALQLLEKLYRFHDR